MELMFDVARLGVFRTQKLSARRQVIKKGTHFHLGPRRFATVAHNIEPAAVDQNFCSGNRVTLACCEAKPGNACNARQSFATKPERCDRLKVLGRPDFTGG